MMNWTTGTRGDGETHSMNDDLYQSLLLVNMHTRMSTQRTGLRGS